MRATKFLPRRPDDDAVCADRTRDLQELVGRIALARDDHDVADRQRRRGSRASASSRDGSSPGSRSGSAASPLENSCGSVVAMTTVQCPPRLGSSPKRAPRCVRTVVPDDDGPLRGPRVPSAERAASSLVPCRSATSRRVARVARGAARPHRGTRGATRRAGGESRRRQPVQPPRRRLQLPGRRGSGPASRSLSAATALSAAIWESVPSRAVSDLSA
jgi:hypothetical protein